MCGVRDLQKNKDKEFTQKEKEWQLMRRGRYVEFNFCLLYTSDAADE